MSTQARPTEGTNNGFWGQVTSGIGEGIGTIGSEILPVWTAQQLGTQQEDQLRNSTFDPRYAQPRNDPNLPTTSGRAQTGAVQTAASQPASITGNMEISTGTAVALVFATIIAGVIVAKVA